MTIYRSPKCWLTLVLKWTAPCEYSKKKKIEKHGEIYKIMADAIQKCWHPIKEAIIPFGVGRNFRLVVAKAVGYRGKLVRLYLPGLVVVCASELYCEKKALTK